MLEPEERERLVKGMLSIRIIWGAYLVALVIYVIISHVIGSDFLVTDSGFPLGTLTVVLSIMAVAGLIAAYFLRKHMLTVGDRSSKSNLFKVPNILTIFGATTDSSPAPVSYLPLSRYHAAVIISIALSESIGIYGLILFIMGSSFLTLYIFIIISAVALFFFRPKLGELEQLAEAMKQQL